MKIKSLENDLSGYRTDNVKLYEKIRYMESFNDSRERRSSSDVRSYILSLSISVFPWETLKTCLADTSLNMRPHLTLLKVSTSRYRIY